MNPTYLSLRTTGSHAPVVTVVVLFHPGCDDLLNLTQMAGWGHEIVAVINACDHALAIRLPTSPRIFYVCNDANVGLARALNQGLDAAVERGAEFVLLLDQDSRPDPTMRERLTTIAIQFQTAGRRIGGVAPTLVDHKMANANVGLSNPDRASNGTLATSGTLIPRSAWLEVGPMWEDLFIDGIDHEWCFRARSLGFETVTSTAILMVHDMGDGAIDFFGRFKPVHRSAVRHYFIVRNTLWLSGRRYIPFRWRASEVAKLIYRIPAYLFFSANTLHSARNMVHALSDGLRPPRAVPLLRFQ
jgi:rhamnosyltransferase